MNLRTEILQALLRSPGSPGARLPSVRTLAKSFGAAPGTARSALAELCDGTRAYAVPGKGCFWVSALSGNFPNFRKRSPNPSHGNSGRTGLQVI